MQKYLLLLFLTSCSAPMDSARIPVIVGDTAPWTMHVIAQPGLLGADGTDVADLNGDGRPDFVSAWEQSGRITVSTSGIAAAYTTEILASAGGGSLGQVEDAVFADIDGDGTMDVVSASESKRLRVHFRGTVPLVVDIAAATNVNRWIKVAIADMDADDRLDIIAGGKTTPAVVAWFESPASPRDGAAWVRHDIGEVSWTMSLEPRDFDDDGDMDVVLSDRQYITTTPRDYSLMGDRWIENTGGTWVNHPIGTVVGNHKFHSLYADGMFSCRSVAGVSTLTHKIRSGTDWVEVNIPAPTGFGECQDIQPTDIDLDGNLDLVLTASAAADTSGVVWLRGPSWDRYEISGPPGTKYDNATIVDVDGDGDPDVVTSEQTEQLGVVWYENPNVPPAIDAGIPDAGPPDAAIDAAPVCLCPCACE